MLRVDQRGQEVGIGKRLQDLLDDAFRPCVADHPVLGEGDPHRHRLALARGAAGHGRGVGGGPGNDAWAVARGSHRGRRRLESPRLHHPLRSSSPRGRDAAESVSSSSRTDRPTTPGDGLGRALVLRPGPARAQRRLCGCDEHRRARAAGCRIPPREQRCLRPSAWDHRRHAPGPAARASRDCRSPAPEPRSLAAAIGRPLHHSTRRRSCERAA